MSEQGSEFYGLEVEDADDVEGHLMYQVDGPEDDDVEGHIQPPRGDDSDHVHSIVRY
ncbi:MAG TPA: hypothetical protein VGK78_00955 [Nocardioides sp.]|uniref:hypothetical protein n=1 Tax=Nocardioides sp. TaxID=35761 RepID=UPI002D991562|nr:hypothetical protein [Marmoricola sp.]